MTKHSITTQPLRYLLIDVDNVASHGSQPIGGIRELVGGAGACRIEELQNRLAFYVSDTAWLDPVTNPLNVVGSVVIGAMDAPRQPYRGPIVITGLDPKARFLQLGDQNVCSLTGDQIHRLTILTSDIRRVLGYEAGKPSVSEHQNWARDVRMYAEMVRTRQVPGDVFSSLDTLQAMLRARSR